MTTTLLQTVYHSLMWFPRLQSLALPVSPALFPTLDLLLSALGPSPCFPAHTPMPLHWLFCLDPFYPLILDRSFFLLSQPLGDTSEEAAFLTHSLVSTTHVLIQNPPCSTCQFV